MATRAVHDVSEDDVGLPSTSLPDGKDEGLQPIANPVPMPPYVLVDPHYAYWSPFAAMPASFSNCGAYNHIPPPPPTGQLHLLTGGMDSSTRNLPTTISPILLQPALYYIPPPEENKGENLAGANGTFSAAEKGKGKAVHFPDDIPAKHPFPEPDELLSEGHPSLDFPSNEKWIESTRPILQDYANRQIALPLCERVSVSLNEPSQFILGALQLLANRDHPNNTPVGLSRQLGPQLLENFTDVHQWATEYFRTRFAMPTVGTDVPVLLTIITNAFYEAHTQLIDTIASAALGNMRTRGAETLDIEDFAFGYDFKMSHDLPFAAKSGSRIRERPKLQSPVNVSINIPKTSRSGRQLKPSKQAQAAAEAESERQAQSRQPKKEKGRKKQEPAATQAMTPNSSGGMMRTPSAMIYHTSNHGGSCDAAENVVVPTGAKCPTCGRVMPPRMPASPPNPHLASQLQFTGSPIASTSRRATTRPAVGSNLRLAPVTIGLSPSVAPQPTIFELSSPILNHAVRRDVKLESYGVISGATALSIPMPSTDILTANVQSAPALEATTGASTTQDVAPARGTSGRGSRRARARGARANRGGRGSRGRGGRAATDTYTLPATLAPAPATDAGLTTNDAKSVNVDSVPGKPSGAQIAVTTNTADTAPMITKLTEIPVCNETACADAVRSEPVGGDAIRTVSDDHGVDTTSETLRSDCPTTTGGSGHVPVVNSEGTDLAANSWHAGYHPWAAISTVGDTANTGEPSGSVCRPVNFSKPEELIVHVPPAGDLSRTTALGNPTGADAATDHGGIHATLKLGSHTEVRQSKKRKLDDSER